MSILPELEDAKRLYQLVNFKMLKCFRDIINPQQRSFEPVVNLVKSQVQEVVVLEGCLLKHRSIEV